MTEQEQMPGELIYEYTIRSARATSPTVCRRWTLCCPVSQTSLRKGGPVRPRVRRADRRPEATRNAARGYEERLS
jgi:hypothetical protein